MVYFSVSCRKMIIKTKINKLVIHSIVCGQNVILINVFKNIHRTLSLTLYMHSVVIPKKKNAVCVHNIRSSTKLNDFVHQHNLFAYDLSTFYYNQPHRFSILKHNKNSTFKFYDAYVIRIYKKKILYVYAYQYINRPASYNI